MNKKYTMMWIAWILAFGAIEFAALQDKREGDTLSEHIWHIIGTNAAKKQPWHWFLRVAVLGLLVWLIVHFSTRWNWFKRKEK